MSWRLPVLALEAWRNMLSSGMRSLVAGVLAAAVLGGIAFLELRDVDDLLGFRADFAASGGHVLLAVPGQGEALRASDCESLNGMPGIVAAGGVRPGALTTFASVPGVLFQNTGITPGMLNVWAPGQRVIPSSGEPWLVVGSALANEVGTRQGLYLAREGEQPMMVAAVLDMKKRNPQASRWALEVVAPAGEITQCWVEFEAGAHAAGKDALPARFTRSSREAVVRPYLGEDQFRRDPVQEFAGRAQANGWLAGAAVIAVLSWLTAWFRRAELGLYLALGTARPTLAALLAFEWWLAIVMALVAGLAFAFSLALALDMEVTGDGARLAIRTATITALTATAFVPVGPFILARDNVLGLLKDR